MLTLLQFLSSLQNRLCYPHCNLVDVGFSVACQWEMYKALQGLTSQAVIYSSLISDDL